jgi:hypothetical protein
MPGCRTSEMQISSPAAKGIRKWANWQYLKARDSSVLKRNKFLRGNRPRPKAGSNNVSGVFFPILFGFDIDYRLAMPVRVSSVFFSSCSVALRRSTASAQPTSYDQVASVP